MYTHPTCAVGQAQVSRTPKGKRKGRRGKRKLPVEEEEEEEGDATVEAMEVSDASPMLSGSDARTVDVRLKELFQVCGICDTLFKHLQDYGIFVLYW